MTDGHRGQRDTHQQLQRLRVRMRPFATAQIVNNAEEVCGWLPRAALVAPAPADA